MRCRLIGRAGRSRDAVGWARQLMRCCLRRDARTSFSAKRSANDVGREFPAAWPEESSRTSYRSRPIWLAAAVYVHRPDRRAAIRAWPCRASSSDEHRSSRAAGRPSRGRHGRGSLLGRSRRWPCCRRPGRRSRRTSSFRSTRSRQATAGGSARREPRRTPSRDRTREPSMYLAGQTAQAVALQDDIYGVPLFATALPACCS